MCIRYLLCVYEFEILTFRYLDSSGVLKSEFSSIWFSDTLWQTEGCTISRAEMTTSWGSYMSTNVRYLRFGGSIKAKCAIGGSRQGIMHRLVSGSFWWNVCFLWDEVVNTFFELHFYNLFFFILNYKS